MPFCQQYTRQQLTAKHKTLLKLDVGDDLFLTCDHASPVSRFN